MKNSSREIMMIVALIAAVTVAPLQSRPFLNNGDGTITDGTTHLKWQKCYFGQNNDTTCSGTPGTRTWQQALQYCDGLTLGGETSWRLPSAKELLTLLDPSRTTAPMINTALFPGTVANSGSARFWTSTTMANVPASAWTLEFDHGSMGGTAPKANANYVRCVSGP